MKEQPKEWSFVDAVCRKTYSENPMAWMATHGRARTKSTEPGAWDRPIRPNVFQEQIGRVVEYCLANKLPIRIIILKPRQRGSSTASTEVLYVLSRTVPMNGWIVGGLAEQYESLWAILEHYNKKDSFGGWNNSFTFNQNECKCSNESLIKHGTAGNVNVGRGSTIHFLLITELAHWPMDGAKSADQALYSVMACVPQDAPGTAIVIESTGNGAGGLFHDTFAGAIDFEDFKKGKRSENGYIRVEAFWFQFADCIKRDLSENDARNYRLILEESNDRDAIQLWDRMPELSPHQIAWWHEILKAPECNGDTIKRRRNYPSEREDAFASSNPSRFNTEGLALLERDAVTCKGLPDGILYGRVEEYPDRLLPSIVQCGEHEAEIMMVSDWRPANGQRHIISVDNMSGISHVSGSDPDTNSVMVIRDGYMMGGKWYPPEPVICTMPLNRWDNKPLSKLIAKLSALYNRAKVVPEANRGEGIIGELRELNVPLLERPRPATDIDHSKPSGKFGFSTTAQSKPALISNLAAYIANPTTDGAGIRIRFQHVIKQLRLFIQHEDGSQGALAIVGAYDDAVIALALGMLFRDQSTVFAPPQISVPIPPDIERLMSQGGNRVVRPVWSFIVALFYLFGTMDANAHHLTDERSLEITHLYHEQSPSSSFNTFPINARAVNGCFNTR